MLLTLEQPLGIVCVITPWNFPLAIPIWKLAPAIGFGNPAEAASGSAVLLTETLESASHRSRRPRDSIRWRGFSAPAVEKRASDSRGSWRST